MVNESVCRVLRERLETNLSPEVVDDLMKSIYTIEMERCASQWFETVPSEEVSIVLDNWIYDDKNNIMKLFPEIEGEGVFIVEWYDIQILN